MDFKLEISRTNLANSYSEVDLFPEQQLEYDLDFYDSLEIDKVKLPFYTKLRIPLTTNNKASNRFNFEPITSPAADFPKEDFYFKVTVFGTSSNTEIAGILNVISFEYNSAQSYIEVELKDYLSKYLTSIKDTKLGDLYKSPKYPTDYYTIRKTLNNFRANTASGGEAGIKGTNPDYTRPISFPYVDFCNDVDGKFGFASRQFLEYGTGIDRTGIMPVFSVPRFLEAIGTYISSTSFPVRVDSRLFALGAYSSAPAFADFEAEKLHMVVPSQLLAKQDVNTRNFKLRQGPSWSGTNQSLDTCVNLNNDEKLIHTPYYGNTDTYGNYGFDSEGEPLYTNLEWGAEKRMDTEPCVYNADTDYYDCEGSRGFFCPKVSFNASIGLDSGATSATISGIKLEIPIVGEDKMVRFLRDATTTMTFKVYVGVYEDGFMVKQIPLQDAQGDDIVLGMQNLAAVEAGLSNKSSTSGLFDYFQCEKGHEGHATILGNGASFEDTFVFEPFTAYFPQNEEIFINGGSRYSINYFIEPFEGLLDVDYAIEYQHGNNPHTATLFDQNTFQVGQLRKLITRLSDYTPLDIKFTANEDTLLYKNTDEFIISDSINKTCPLNVSEILTAVLKRFDCGVFYEYDSSALKIYYV